MGGSETRRVDDARFRPSVICIETLVSGTNDTIPEVETFLNEQGHAARGGAFVNTILVDERIL